MEEEAGERQGLLVVTPYIGAGWLRKGQAAEGGIAGWLEQRQQETVARLREETGGLEEGAAGFH